jgi:hypothetical protein
MKHLITRAVLRTVDVTLKVLTKLKTNIKSYYAISNGLPENFKESDYFTSVRQIALYLGKSTRSVYDYRVAGLIPFCYHRGMPYVKKTDLFESIKNFPALTNKVDPSALFPRVCVHIRKCANGWFFAYCNFLRFNFILYLSPGYLNRNLLFEVIYSALEERHKFRPFGTDPSFMIEKLSDHINILSHSS